MKKWIAIALCLALSLGMLAAASAGAARPSSLFCYVIDASANSFTVLTDDEVQLTFKREADTSVASKDGTLNMDDVALVQYTGTLNLSTDEQAVQVNAVRVLNTLYGTVNEASTMNAVAIQTLNDDGAHGPVYYFDREGADIKVGEEGILIGDDVEVAFEGDPARLAPDQVQDVGYVHITVFGQIEDTFE